MKDEMNSWYKNQTLVMVERQEKKKTIACKWIFKLKESPRETVRCNVRLVAKEFTQKQGKDYNEVFSPIVNTR